MQSITIVIKTIPDVDAGRRLYKIQNLSDHGVAKAMFHLQQQKVGSEELPHYLQRIISIAICKEGKGGLDTKIFGGRDISEQTLLEQYVSAVEGKQEVTWDGNNFEFPIIKYRALKNNVALPYLTQQLDMSDKISGKAKSEPPSLYEISSFLELSELEENNAYLIWDLWKNNKTNVIGSSAQREAENIHQIFTQLYPLIKT